MSQPTVKIALTNGDRQLFTSCPDEDIAFVMALEAKIEVDSAPYGVYRVWIGIKLIGTFYRCTESGKWVAEPAYTDDPELYDTSDEVQQAIQRAWRQLP